MPIGAPYDTAQTVLFLTESISPIEFCKNNLKSNVDVDNPISKNGNFRSSVLTNETKGLDVKKVR